MPTTGGRRDRVERLYSFTVAIGSETGDDRVQRQAGRSVLLTGRVGVPYRGLDAV